MIVLCCLCSGGRKKKGTKPPTVPPMVTATPPQQAYGDVKRGEKPKSRGTKDGSMIILPGPCSGGGCGGGG
ncbi:hypothetical protein F0562_008097, partial [Nyssa sinensis]